MIKVDYKNNDIDKTYYIYDCFEGASPYTMAIGESKYYVRVQDNKEKEAFENLLKEVFMSKYKVGDEVYIKGIIEEVDATDTRLPYRVFVDGSGMQWCAEKAIANKECLTPQDHAKALQEYCRKKIKEDFPCEESCDLCKGTNQKCLTKTAKGSAIYPCDWKLDQTQKLTKEEIGILEFWKKQGASVIVRNDNKSCLEFLSNEIIPNGRGFVGRQQYMYKIYFKELEKDKNYNIDDLLKGEIWERK